MNVTRAHFIRVLFVTLTLVACTTQVRADDTEDVKKAISTQLELLKAGKVDELKTHFTERQSKKINADLVKIGQKEAGAMTLDDLVASVAFGEFDGKKTAKITMKNGRTLTTLVLTDGKWLADTLWFK